MLLVLLLGVECSSKAAQEQREQQLPRRSRLLGPHTRRWRSQSGALQDLC